MHETLAALQSQLAKSTDIIAGLSLQLKESLDGNAELRSLLIDLQAKLDKLITQKKKRDRTDFGPTTERHNPRPALAGGSTATPAKPPAPARDRNHQKHIHNQNIPTEPVHHNVQSAESICPTCVIDTVFVGTQTTFQLEKIIHTIKRLQHEQEIRACPKCKQYIVTAE